MADAKADPGILWNTLKLSAEPLRGRSGILVVAQVRARRWDRDAYNQYRVHFEINRAHGLVSYDAEVLASSGENSEPTWRHSIRRDIVVAIRDHFLRSQLYSHLAGELGWVSETSE